MRMVFLEVPAGMAESMKPNFSFYVQLVDIPCSFL
jgi:hypothetical protein